MTPTCYPALQLSPSWTEEGDSKGTHGACKIVQGTDTTPMEIHFAPAKRPVGQNWDNVYVLHRNAASAASMWVYEVSVTFPTKQDIANCNAYEMDFQKNDGKTIFNLGWQFLFSDGLRIWNRGDLSGSGKWWPTTIPASKSDFVAGEPTRIVLMFSHDATHVTYWGVAVNGVWYPMAVTYPAVAKTQTPYVNNAVQLDSLGQGAPISLLLNECNLTGF